jgi:uncharacterized phage protein (TIGR02218 family)
VTRSVPANILTVAQSGLPTLAWAVVITRQDSTVFRWSTLDRDIEIGGNDYLAAPGIDIKSLAMSAGFAVDNTEVRIIEDADITRADILAGRWDAAEFSLGLFNWKAPADGLAMFLVGTLGAFKPRHGEFIAELRDLRQALQQDTTDVVQPDCRYRFGDAKCALDITGPPFTVSKTVGTVTSRYVFSAPGTEIDDYFGAGEVLFTSGLNIGLRFLVSGYASATDTFTLALPTPFTITPGDTFTAIAGCRKNPDACKAHGNYLNYGGEPDKARIDKLLAGAL